MDHEIYNVGTVEIIPMYLVFSKIYGKGENFQRFNTFSLIGNTCIGPTLWPEPWPKAHEFYNFDISPYVWELRRRFFLNLAFLGEYILPRQWHPKGRGGRSMNYFNWNFSYHKYTWQCSFKGEVKIQNIVFV